MLKVCMGLVGKRNGFMVWAEGRASRKESRRHSLLELIKDRPWMTSILSM
jgi:hypothetical protein